MKPHFIGLLAMSLAGCGSSQYRPVNSPRITVVQQGLGTVYYRNGYAYGDLRDAVAGNAAAEREANTAHALGAWSGALGWGGIGAEVGGFVMMGAGQTDAVRGAGFGLVLAGVGSAIAALVVANHSISHAHDAVSIYNDGVDNVRGQNTGLQEPPVPSAMATSAVPPRYPARTESRSSLPPTLPNEPGHRHDGFYFRFTSGLQYVSYSGEGPSGSASLAHSGPSSLIGAGGTVHTGLVVAGSLWTNYLEDSLSGAPAGTTREANARFLGLGLLLDWFPKERGGWHVGTNLGFGGPTINYEGGFHMDGTGLAAALLGGYDFWIGPEWSLGVMATASATPPIHLRDDQGHDTGYRLKTLSFGIEGSLLFH